ncbi:MAG TPA: hypothetical protein EYP71_03120 [Dehalococcoidia bacterium]|nr:hypothetical protein [Dehalococcoidia bacterium]
MGIKGTPHCGWLINLVTFPGIVAHEWAHQFLCRRTKVPVYKTCYFRFGNPAGYVIHGPVDSFGKAFLIDVAPLVINTVIAAILFHIAVALPPGIAAVVFCWLGVSIAMHSFPSSSDADSLWQYSKRALKGNPLVLLGLPLVGLVKVWASLNRVWLNLLYAVALLLLVVYATM